MTDPTIHEQSYHYFLQEAQEILQDLEQELLSLQENYSINKVYTLMRLAHTLKGAAATVGLETIKTVTHSLEDIFKALCKPGLSIDSETEALLFEGYECLRLSLTSTLTEEQVNDAEVLDRTATVFTQLQEKLGDCFSQEAYIPNSVELGFDVTQSIFEFGVTQRLDEIATALASANSDIIATTLRTQAEIFFGLAESLNLQGFGAIAQAAIAALNAHPEQVVTITQAALADFQKAQKDVLNGDRSQGGQPSIILQQLSGLHISLTDTHSPQDTRVEAQDLATKPELDSVTSTANSELNLLSELQKLELSLSDSKQEESLLNRIWGGKTVIEPPYSPPTSKETSEKSDPSPHLSFSASKEEPEEVAVKMLPITTPEASTSASPQKNQISLPHTVRVNIEHLEHLNNSVGELLTNQNRQSLQNEQLQAAVRTLLVRLQQHQQRLSQLQEWSDRLFIPEQTKHSTTYPTNHPKSNIAIADVDALRAASRRVRRSTQIENTTICVHPRISAVQNSKLVDRFDSLELNHDYSESQILIQSVLEDVVQLAEAADAIELFTRQSNETLEKQRHQLTSIRDTLMQARMLPLEDVFNRFPRILQQLGILHNKLVKMELRGTEVLVDKVVAEKLYDPLLHLVRNAFDHGIESPKVRLQQGKQELGQIEICAYQQDKYLMIEVQDDGQGLNFAKIRASAVDRQLVSPTQADHLNEVQLTDLLFEPGFSTASTVNDLSGRGFGLDVVRTQLQALKGSISVHSKRHQGTTFKLQIPLSLTIAKLLLCQANNHIYGLFTDAIEQILIPQAHQIQAWEGGKVLRWGQGAEERLVPIHQLSKILNYFRLTNPLISQSQHSLVQEESMMPVMLIRYQDRLLGLEVDQMLEEQELVIRPLGQMIVPPSYVYGGSILADGRLMLVLNVLGLMQYVLNQQTNFLGNSYGADVTHYTNLNPQTLSRAWLTSDLASSTPQIFTTQQQRQLPAQTRAFLPPATDLDVKTRQDKIILIVDDSITVRQTLTMTLQKAGYLVLQAKDGYEALEQLRQQTGIELVLCDIEMPKMNGFEFLKYRQQDPNLTNIPVVMLTSRSGEKHRAIAFRFGATDYITKPYMEHKLLMTVKDVIEKNIKEGVRRQNW